MLHIPARRDIHCDNGVSTRGLIHESNQRGVWVADRSIGSKRKAKDCVDENMRFPNGLGECRLVRKLHSMALGLSNKALKVAASTSSRIDDMHALVTENAQVSSRNEAIPAVISRTADSHDLLISTGALFDNCQSNRKTCQFH
jgi:hypothetical protein